MDRAEIVAFWKHNQEVWQTSNATGMTNLGGMDVVELITTGHRSGEKR